jgi:hypothetical protein
MSSKGKVFVADRVDAEAVESGQWIDTKDYSSELEVGGAS